MNGIVSAESGYAGGFLPNPTYRDVCTGTSGHAEVVRLVFDPAVVTYGEILDVFFAIHDATTRDRQGSDVGPQYRSVIFYENEAQREAAGQKIRELEAKSLAAPVVTEVTPAPEFHKAEAYHQKYFESNASQPYCSFVVAPKVRKFLKEFAAKSKR